MAQPSNLEIERFVGAFEILSSFEAQQRDLRGWGAFGPSWPRPDPSCVRCLEWLKELTGEKPMRHNDEVVVQVPAPAHPEAVNIPAPVVSSAGWWPEITRMKRALGLITAWEDVYPVDGPDPNDHSLTRARGLLVAHRMDLDRIINARLRDLASKIVKIAKEGLEDGPG